LTCVRYGQSSKELVNRFPQRFLPSGTLEALARDGAKQDPVTCKQRAGPRIQVARFFLVPSFLVPRTGPPPQPQSTPSSFTQAQLHQLYLIQDIWRHFLHPVILHRTRTSPIPPNPSHASSMHVATVSLMTPFCMAHF